MKEIKFQVLPYVLMNKFAGFPILLARQMTIQEKDEKFLNQKTLQNQYFNDEHENFYLWVKEI